MSGQNCFENYFNYREKNEMISLKTLDNLLNGCSQDTILYQKLSHRISTDFYREEKFSDAIKYAKIEVDFLEELNRDRDMTYDTALYNLGLFYLENKEYAKAIECYEKLIPLHITSERVGQSYGGIGLYYKRKGELYKALDYFKKSMYVLENAEDKTHYSDEALITIYANAALVYDLLNTQDASMKGIEVLKKADSICLIEDVYVNTETFYALNNQYANLYSNIHLNNFKKAQYYYHKNLKKALVDKDSFVISNTYLNLGELYLKYKSDSARVYLKNSLLVSEDEHLKNAESYRNISQYYALKEDHGLALENIQKSLNWSFGIPENASSINPSQLQLFQTADRRNIFKALRSKIHILFQLYEKIKAKNYLTEIANTVTISDRLVDIIIENSSDINTKLLWRKEASDTFVLGIKAAYLLSDENLMFHLMEKNKVLLLLRDIKQNTKQYNLPKHLFDKKIMLKKEILALENKLEKLSDKNERNTLFDLKKQYKKLTDSIEIQHPTFANNNLQIEHSALDEIQNQLDAETIIISYDVLNENDKAQSLFGLVISQNKTHRFYTKNIQESLDKLTVFRNLISRPLETKSDLLQFKEVSYYLFDHFFPGDDLKTMIQNKHLIIIPDVTMQNIPFEAFSTKNDTLEYLIMQNDISYSYSTSFLKHNSTIARQTSKTFTGFAPVEFSNNKLIELYNTKNEISTINTIIKGDTFLYKDATKDNFMNASHDSKIIHLATHAKAEKNPEIYFVKDTMKLHELYTYKNNADLVVLSACSTNIGEVNKGEGVFSLARGFFYAGANSVVSSLWNANDTATSWIMASFYKDLYNAKSKAEALNNAKRKYINEHSLSETSPFYWASFVLIGDTKPAFTSSFNFYYLLLIFPVFILLILLFKKQNSRL